MDVFEKTGEGMLEISLVAAAAGLILGVVSITGLGFSFSVALIQLSGGNFLILLLLAATGAIVLGMGMTVTAAYILVVILIAPALIQLGMIPIAAHMFVFYYAVLSFLTPPICLAVYTAASLAGAEPMRTALQSIRLGIAAYLVPLVFAFSPALLFEGSPIEILFSAIMTALGIAILATGLEGYGLRKLHWVESILLVIGGGGLLIPFWPARIGGTVTCLSFIVYELLYRRYVRKLVPVGSTQGKGVSHPRNGR